MKEEHLRTSGNVLLPLLVYLSHVQPLLLHSQKADSLSRLLPILDMFRPLILCILGVEFKNDYHADHFVYFYA